jgi:large subunit ribosomal protein L18
MGKSISKNKIRQRKHARVRKKISGTKERPRLNVYRSLTNIYAQIIDDNDGKTIVAASSRDAELQDKVKNGGNVKAAEAVGELISKKAKTKKIKSVVFDRGGYIYHGRVKALADAARKGGLEF